MALLELERITKQYGQTVTALKGFNLSVEEGEMLALMGKSGSGKSTVLNIISGIDRLQKGNYKFGNQDMSKVKGDGMTVFRRDNIGFVLQHFALIQDATIYDNIALPLRLARKPKAEIKERVKKMAVELGIEKQLKKYPKELSGGEAQRAASDSVYIRSITSAFIKHSNLLSSHFPLFKKCAIVVLWCGLYSSKFTVFPL